MERYLLRFRPYQLAVGLILAVLPFSVAAAYGDTTTWVSQIYWGDNEARQNMYLDFPTDITRDASGNFYIADTYNNVIRKINTAGAASTVFGKGSYGNGSDELAYPQGIAVDNSGIIYVADTDNNAIQKIQNGVATVLANNLKKPEAVGIYGNDVLFLDTGNHELKKVSKTGGTITTIVSGLNNPKKFTILGDIVYIANSGSHQVVQVNLSTGNTSVVAGTGVAGSSNGSCATATFNNIWGVTSDGNHTLYVSDGNGFSDLVRTIDLSTCTVALFASDKNMISLNFPAGLIYSAGHIYVANSGIGTIHRFAVIDANDSEIYAGYERFQNDNDRKLLGRPVSMVRRASWIYFIENNKIKRIHRKTKELQLVAGNSVDNYNEAVGTKARFSSPTALAINQAGTLLYVSDRWNHRIRKVDLTTNTVSYLTGAGDINGNGSKNNGYAEGKACLDEFSAKVGGCAYFNQPTGLVLSADEQYLFVADAGNNVIRKVNVITGVTELLVGMPQQAGLVNGAGEAARFHTPWSITANKAGTVLYVTDRDNHVIRQVDIASKEVITLAGNGLVGYSDGVLTSARFSYPDTIVARGKKLYITEAGSQRIRLIDLSLGVTKLVAGSGNVGWKNGKAKLAEFNGPMGIIVEKKKLLVADNRNDQIRMIDISGVAPFADPAPTIMSVRPTSNKVASKTTDTKALQIFGSNFRHGAKVYFGTFSATQVFVNSNKELSVVIPFGKMSPGYYEVKVVNTDGQSDALLRGYSISDSNNSVPMIDYWAN